MFDNEAYILKISDNKFSAIRTLQKHKHNKEKLFVCQIHDGSCDLLLLRSDDFVYDF